MKTEKLYIENCRKGNSINRLFQTVFLIVLFLSALCSNTPAQEAGGVNAPLEVYGNYRIGVGDVLKVVVFKQDLLSMDGVRVSNEGTIRMPALKGDISAACHTEAELAAMITDQYKEYLLDPQVYVAVKEYNSNQVAVIGSVLSPGRFQLQRPTRLLELLTYVNGPSQNAGKNVQIIHNTNIKGCTQNPQSEADNPAVDDVSQEMLTLPLAKVMNGDEDANPFVRAGDIVRIGEAQQFSAYIIGNVKSALTVNLKEPVTLSKAIAMAGGVASGAQIEKIKISRPTEPGSLKKTEIIVNLKEIQKQSREDILLQPDDIVDVPGPSGTRKMLKDIFRSVIPAVTRMPIMVP